MIPQPSSSIGIEVRSYIVRSKYYDLHTLHDVYMRAVQDVSLRKDVFTLTRVFLRDMYDAFEGTGTPKIPAVPLLFRRLVTAATRVLNRGVWEP